VEIGNWELIYTAFDGISASKKEEEKRSVLDGPVLIVITFN
jgi:hypothetical protein